MSNNTNVLEVKDEVVSNIKAGKGLDSLVRSALGLYDKSNKMLHLTASGVIFHALYHGNTTPMNTFFTGIEAKRMNDATAFKAYVKFIATVVDLEGEEKNLFVFSKEKGFRLNPKFGENIRKSTVTFEDLIASKPFYTADVSPAKKPDVGLAELLAMLKKAVTKTETKGDELAIDIPAHILQAGKELIRQIDNTDVSMLKPAVKAEAYVVAH